MHKNFAITLKTLNFLLILCILIYVLADYIKFLSSRILAPVWLNVLSSLHSAHGLYTHMSITNHSLYFMAGCQWLCYLLP